MSNVAAEVIQKQIEAREKSISEYKAEILSMRQKAEVLAGCIDLDEEAVVSLRQRLSILAAGDSQPAPVVAEQKPLAPARQAPEPVMRQPYAVAAGHGERPAGQALFPAIQNQEEL